MKGTTDQMNAFTDSDTIVLEPDTTTPGLRYEKDKGGIRHFPIGESIRIGRHPYNEVSVGDNSMSRFHCWVSKDHDKIIIEDLGSSNGTLVNGTAIQEPTILKPGDRVTVGKSDFDFAA